ncbi:MAG: filamentous hemagglutinin N-terminal domain-containing protein, partial [Candidatus Omnitrophota bacterium]
MYKTLILIIIISIALGQNVYALPQGENVVSGSASFDRSQPKILDVNVTTDKLIANYQSFSIAADEVVCFHQPSSNSVALNRVVGADPSNIFGALTANGKIFLVNPNGVLFGKGCRVDAAGLVASTLDISNDNFLNENYVFSGQGGLVVNRGNISCPGGYVALLGETVENSGVIEARLGKIMIACGQAITLSLDPQGIMSVVVDEQTVQNLENKDDAIKNTGELISAGGKVILTAKSLDGIFKNAINNEGIICVDSLTQKDGEVILEANQRVRLSGDIDAGEGTVNLDCQGADFLGDIDASEGIFKMNDGDTELAGGTYNGNMSWLDNEHITVTGDITVNNGSITIIADADGGKKPGDFSQDSGTIITTTSVALGDIAISGREVTTGNIVSAKEVSINGQREVTINDSIIAAAAVAITSDNKDVVVGRVAGTDITVTADSGKVIDGNAGLNNITADNLVISAKKGIGSGDALETTVTNLGAANDNSGNVEIDNIGNLIVGNVTNHGDISLTTSLDLTVSGEVNSVVGGVDLTSSDGEIIASGAGPHLKAATDSFISGSTTAGSSGDAFDLLVPGADVTVTLSGVLDADRGFFTGSTLSDTLTVENTSSGVMYFNGAQIWPALPPAPAPIPDPIPIPAPVLPPAPDPDPTPDLIPSPVLPTTTTANPDIIPYLANIMAKKVDRGYLELSDSLVILSANQATPHFYASQAPIFIDSSALDYNR